MTIDIGDWLSQSNGPSEPCGLFIPRPSEEAEGAAPQKNTPVPLRRRDVTATVYADACFADTVETLSFIADVDCTAVFRFPLPPRAAVYRFRATFGDKEVATRVKPRSQAREEFDLAVSQGHSAAHVSQHEAGASVFEVSLGNLEAHTEVEVQLGYLRLLERFGDTLEWGHTATWVPPYTGSKGDADKGVEKVLGSLPVFTDKVSYTLSYKVDVLAEACAVRAIESPEPVTLLPPAPVEGDSATTEGGLVRWHVSLSEAVADPSKDLTLTIELEPNAARRSRLQVQRTPARAGEGGESRTVALATFVPPPPPPLAGGALKKELWFVVDCSGSMDGNPIRQAREAALFFVRDLPVSADVRFNVTCFGSAHKSLWPACRPYAADTEGEAVAWVQRHVWADMGGTEILAVMQHIYNSPIAPGFTRELIFLTDGGISGHEEQAVYDLVSHRKGSIVSTLSRAPATAPRTHVLCLGIGHGVHRGLLDGLASRTDGAAVCVVDEEAIAAKAAFLKRAATARGAALRPRLAARGALVRAAPHVLPQRLFAGEPLHVLLEVVNCEADATLELTAEYGSEGPAEGAAPPPPLRLTLPLGAAAGPGARVAEGEALGVLHAMAYIGSLLSGSSPLHVRPDGTQLPAPSPDVVRDAVVRLAVSQHLVTPHTSAVGVALRRDPADPQAASNVVEVPLQFPHGRMHARSLCMAAPRMTLMSCAAPVTHMKMKKKMMGAPQPAADLDCAGACVFDCKELARGEAIADLSGMAAPLAASAEHFQRCGRTVKNQKGGFGVVLSGIASMFGGGVGRQKAEAAPPPAPPAAAAAAAAPPPPPFGSLVNSATVADDEGGGAQECAARNTASCARAADGSDSSSYAAEAEEEASDGSEEARDSASSRASPPSAPASSPLSGPALLERLNLSRDTLGFWTPSPELASALGLPQELLGAGSGSGSGAVHPAAALRPAGLSGEGWATVCVLARLRVSLGAQRGVWADMEAKALAWLAGVWPPGARSVGSTVLAVAKAMQAA